MSTFSRIFVVLGMVITLGITIPAFAESAPVYDVDSGFDNAPADQGQQQDLLPPPPGQEGAYVPSSQQQDLQPMPMSAPTTAQRPPQIHLSMEQRVQRMEQQIDNMQTGDSSERLNSLQNQVQSLRGQLEQLNHQLQQMQNQQKSMYSDLDKRLVQTQQTASRKKSNTSAIAANSSDSPTIEASPEATKPNTKLLSHKKTKTPLAEKPTEPLKVASIAKSTSSQPDVAEEQEIYQTAYNMIKAKKYNEAVNTLKGMLQKYPSGQFASNAHYWLGELYGLMNKNDQALDEFGTVVKTFPNSPRVSDAQLKVGLILAMQSKWVDAKAAFKKVMSRYPGTASARLAGENLKQIKQAGH